MGRLGVILALLVLGVAIDAAVEPPAPTGHTCGQGPQTIEVILDGCCGCSLPPPDPPVIDRNGEYHESMGGTTIAVCCGCGSSTQRWTDWPECGGTRIVP